MNKKIKKLENIIFQNNLNNEIEKKKLKKIRLVKNKIEKKTKKNNHPISMNKVVWL
jgi:hypothetical protein